LLSERDYAFFRLGWGLFLAFQKAAIDGDRQFVELVGKRIGDVVCPESREQFAGWLKPGGPLRLFD
jgi:hypothetical protein